MSKYVKSYSNYVLKTKHQETNDGIIYERDITTIGGRDHFSAGQVPIYRSGNFIITINNDDTSHKKSSTQGWESNKSGDTWTLDILKDYEKDEKSSYDKKIVIKKDYYDFRDFAYYGSCSELIRTSINNIIDTYPGELFEPIVDYWVVSGVSSDTRIFYTEEAANAYKESILSGSTSAKTTGLEAVYTKIDSSIDPTDPSGDSNSNIVTENFVIPGSANTALYVIDNPFGIDIHSNLVLDKNKPLKYFAEDGYKNYMVYAKNGDEWDFESGYTITSVTFTRYDGYDYVDEKGNLIVKIDFCPGEYMGTVNISAERVVIIDGQPQTQTITAIVHVFMGDNNEVKYFFTDVANIRIRPKKEIIEKYYDSLSLFEKVLLDRDTNFEATFEVIKESDYGYYTDTEVFKFPTTYGGYNLGSKDSIFTEYVERLVKIGKFYDDYFSDNLWRSMTHEAIKNFDWTYTRRFNPGDEEEYIEGGNKIQKIIRLYGREFDEIKGYIDAIGDNNNVTYDNINNLPDYFFSDKLEDDGWDVKLVNLFKLKDKSEKKCSFSNDFGEEKYYPYSKDKITSVENPTKCDSYFDETFGASLSGAESCSLSVTETSINIFKGDGYNNGYHNKCCEEFKIYSSEKAYTSSDVNSEFLKRFILNSKHILRHKGTTESIEMLLSLFGMRSKNYVFKNDTYFKVVDSDNNNVQEIQLTEEGKKYYKDVNFNKYKPYDFDVKEYTVFTTRIQDGTLIYDNDNKKWIIDIEGDVSKLNGYKLTRTRGTADDPYNGLPVYYRDKDVDSDHKERYIYPSFQNYLSYDGLLYYQMNGGWLSKYPCTFDKDDTIVSAETTGLFTETIRNIKSVQTLDELLSNKSLAQHKGDICEVVDLPEERVIIDGVVYDLLTDESNNKYFNATVENNSLSVGNSFFTDYVVISGPNGNIRINLNDDFYNGKTVKIYLSDNTVDVHSDTDSISTVTVFSGGTYLEYLRNHTDKITNYFILNNPDYSDELSVMGWKQLSSDEYDYYVMNTIVDNDKGNNPHTGHGMYDKGHEYLLRFRRLFKPIYENSLFDLSLVTGNTDVYAESYECGFKGLISEDDCNLNYDNYLQIDDKCHYFGDYFKRDGETTIVTTAETYDLNDSKFITGTTRYTDLKFGELSAYTYGDKAEGTIDGVTNQIVNTKRVDIDFYLTSQVEYSKEWLEEVKYIDAVILPYLTQVIPSTVILSVNFKNKVNSVKIK